MPAKRFLRKGLSKAFCRNFFPSVLPTGNAGDWLNKGRAHVHFKLTRRNENMFNFFLRMDACVPKGFAITSNM